MWTPQGGGGVVSLTLVFLYSHNYTFKGKINRRRYIYFFKKTTRHIFKVGVIKSTCPSTPPSILPVIVAEIRVQRVQIKSRGRSGAQQLRDHLSPRDQGTIRGSNLAALRSLKSDSYRRFDR